MLTDTGTSGGVHPGGYFGRTMEQLFVQYGEDLFSSEDLTDTLLRIYLEMAVSGWVGPPVLERNLDAVVGLYRDGLWLPCEPRIALAGQIDVANDGLPQSGALPIRPADTASDAFHFVHAARIARLPRGYAALQAGPLYRVTTYCRAETGAFDRAERKRLGPESGKLEVAYWYFSVIRDRLVPAIRQGEAAANIFTASLASVGAVAIQAAADTRRFWLVETEEEPLGRGLPVKTPIRLGVRPGVVSSLFYARSLPVSETGRRRPLLHWVRAHQRRLRDGVEVDIGKHLRGATEFEMDGFPFRVTEPVKPTPRR